MFTLKKIQTIVIVAIKKTVNYIIKILYEPRQWICK